MAEKILRGIDYRPTLDRFSSLGEFFFEFGQINGDKTCQIDADLGTAETYSSVRKRSTRVAISLQKKGVAADDVISTCSYNTVDYAIPVIAAAYLGAKVVNFDPTLSVRNTKHLLDCVKPRIIFVQEGSLSLIEGALVDTDLTPEIITFERTVDYQCFADMVRFYPDEDEFRPTKVDKDDIGMMLFSSGTSGLPKAVCHSHRSFLLLTEIVQQSHLDLRVVFHATTFYWISGIIMLTLTFLKGGTRVFARDLKGESTFKAIEQYRVTTLFAAPYYTYELTRVRNPERFDVSSFRCLLTGGTCMSTEQFQKLTRLFPKTDIIFGYGMTEVGVVARLHSRDDPSMKIGSCGTVAPLCRIKIVDPNTGRILGPNQKGEVCVKTPGAMKGYYKVDAPCFDSEGYIRSGDLGYYDEDRCLYVVERMKEMFKYLTWHIVPSSIEAVILEHPGVKETVVFGIPRGEKGDVPAACVVLNDNFDVQEEEIKKFVEERVSDIERLRGGVFFLKKLPRTPSGKLIRTEARNIAIKIM